MQISRDEIIKFILTNNPLSKKEELEKLSLKNEGVRQY